MFYIFNLILVEKNGSHLSSKKLLFATNRDHYRKAQLIKIQRAGDSVFQMAQLIDL